MDYIQLGKNIRYIRKKCAVTQEALAEKCNISPVFVSQIENGMRKPSLETVCSIASALSVTVDELLHIHNGIFRSEKDFTALLETRTASERNFCYEILKRMLENMENGSIHMQDER